MIGGFSDSHGLADLIARRHDDEQIHVAVLVWFAISVRTKQDDLVRLKALRDLSGQSPDRRHRGQILAAAGGYSPETARL